MFKKDSRWRSFLSKLSLPPHIAWPLFILGILLMSFTAMTITIVAAHSGRGTQVVEDYYAKALTWDETTAARLASDRLGWRADVTVRLPEAGGQLCPVEIALYDAEGEALPALQGTVRLGRPQLARAVTELPLTAHPDRPGVYRLLMPITAPGLWDFDIRASRGDDHFVTSVRKEVTL